MPDLLTDTEPEITLADEIRCITREVNMRLKVYPGRILLGKMTEAAATRELLVMDTVLSRLKGIANV